MGDFKGVYKAKAHMTKVNNLRPTNTKMLNFERSNRHVHYVKKAYGPQCNFAEIKANFIVKMAEYDANVKCITNYPKQYETIEDTLLDKNRICNIDQRFDDKLERNMSSEIDLS